MNRPKRQFDAFKSKDDYFAAFEYYKPNIRGFIKSKTGNKAVDDLLSETFLNGFNRCDNFRGGCFKTWIFLVARTTIQDHFNALRRRSTVALEEFPEWNVAARIQERGYDQVRDRVFLDHALTFVGEDTATALRLHADSPLPEVADDLGLPYTTIKSRVLRGQRLIKRAFPEMVAA